MKLDPVASLLIGFGLALALAGLLWQMGWLQSLKLGRLPGDIVIERENFRFYFPITSGLLLSAFLTLLSWIFRRLSS